jgi:hypothetical protein
MEMNNKIIAKTEMGVYSLKYGGKTDIDFKEHLIFYKAFSFALGFMKEIDAKIKKDDKESHYISINLEDCQDEKQNRYMLSIMRKFLEHHYEIEHLGWKLDKEGHRNDDIFHIGIKRKIEIIKP